MQLVVTPMTRSRTMSMRTQWLVAVVIYWQPPGHLWDKKILVRWKKFKKYLSFYTYLHYYNGVMMMLCWWCAAGEDRLRDEMLRTDDISRVEMKPSHQPAPPVSAGAVVTTAAVWLAAPSLAGTLNRLLLRLLQLLWCVVTLPQYSCPLEVWIYHQTPRRTSEFSGWFSLEDVVM